MSTVAAQNVPYSQPPHASDAPEDLPRSQWAHAWRQLTHNRLSLACLIIVGVYALAGLVCFTPLLDKKVEQVIGKEYERPALFAPGTRRVDLYFWLGTDIRGRSVLWRAIYGTRIALTITVVASILSLGIGVTLGVIAGYFGGWIDELITWMFTTVNSVPWILLVLALVYALRGFTIFRFELPELWIIIAALGFTDWVGICRLIRGEVLKHRDRDYVYAARAVGLGSVSIVFRHILPNVFHLVIITFSLGAVAYVQAEVVLTFLGLGISEKPSWGRMIDDAKLELMRGVWWQLIAATVAIGILCLALNLLGDALRDALDPRLRGVD
jgi:ABC-type dipeptide/oligopeptide/nickel transport system permease subunit